MKLFRQIVKQLDRIPQGCEILYIYGGFLGIVVAIGLPTLVYYAFCDCGMFQRTLRWW